MSGPTKPDHMPITDRRQLVEELELGCKPADQYKIGTEHEKFVFCNKNLKPAAYDGEKGIRTILTELQGISGWKPIMEGEHIIGLTGDGASVSLEPGGQLELSGAPLATIHQTCSELKKHLTLAKTVGDRLDIGMLGMGFSPNWRRDEINWMPKGRYAIMRRNMERKGSLGLDMMSRTCTVQVNLDFSTEADMIKKMRVSLALQPLATALFANSPFTEGKVNGYESYRAHIWTDTDADRTGGLELAFEDGFGFERYVDYVLDVPMYFVYRDGQYLDASDMSFRDFLAGKLPLLPGELPTISDWRDHLTTVFPDVRLKRYIEMRGADGGAWDNLCALPAIWVGLLYDNDVLDQADRLVSDWTAEERDSLRKLTPTHGLNTPFRDGTLRDLGKTVLDLAREGLKRRAELDWVGVDERGFLNPLFETVETGITPAAEKRKRFETEWNGAIEPLYREYAY
ncbi:MAG: glutamate--cysteine ligase [Micavibrio sp. TMED2]|nr:glutamate--cysteine ligase [Alphaproteobacteria bacterium]MAS47801.1 glutamate--cysteine ligase [Alphaproteobacteria bacterium]MAX96963.1 glutamate--cysteine ligase [Alphaproteobacteria bacterium]OUT40225.1 MAG: glutamate--cysteine ligase [Micavibrio sp. TMED2]|tara:strand:- start:12976 stop:14343 length:1368 start_codon:yes stop_codon:yes gene_type:complete